jgi:hypothetical protein
MVPVEINLRNERRSVLSHETCRGGAVRPGQRKAQVMSPDQFRNALTEFTEAVTALALYTHALTRIAATHRSAESKGHTPDGECPPDILEKIARQLARATSGLRELYACRGITYDKEAALRAEDTGHDAKSGSRQRKRRSGSEAAPPTESA